MFNWRPKDRQLPKTPRGYRAYAIGDIHGRLDLLDQLIGTIERDIADRPPRKTLLVFLGDLIDRGPDSRGVVDRLKNFRHDRLKPYFLAGNHEEVLLRILAGERHVLADWLKFGGVESLASYGFDASTLELTNERASLAAVRKAIPDDHARFIASFSDTLSFGDYLFVHAGIRPGLDLSMQSQKDLRWIRSPFLDDESDHGRVVVHGHSICSSVEVRSNRIGIDTGAYRSGILTALAVDGESRWFLDTGNGSESGQIRPAMEVPAD
jgi:serine/threonine protein phosphatase 1